MSRVCEGLGAGQGLWKVGTSVRKSISHSTCLCLRMKCCVGATSRPLLSQLYGDLALAQSRRGMLDLQKFQTTQPVSICPIQRISGAQNRAQGIPQVFQSQN